MTKNTQKLERLLSNFRRHYELGLSNLGGEYLWKILAHIDFSSQEHEALLTTILAQIKEKEGLSSALAAARDTFHHAPSEQTRLKISFQKKMEALLEQLFHEDEPRAVDHVTVMTQHQDHKIREFGMNRLLTYLESLSDSDSPKAADILLTTYREIHKKLDLSTEERRRNLARQLVSPAYIEAKPTSAFSLLNFAYEETIEGSRAQGYLIEILLPLMNNQQIELGYRFSVAANMVCQLSNETDSDSPLAKDIEVAFNKLAKELLKQKPCEALEITAELLERTDKAYFYKNSLCKKTIGKTFLTAAAAASDNNHDRTFSILEKVYKSKRNNSEEGFYDKVAEQILSLGEKLASSEDYYPSTDGLRNIFRAARKDNSTFKKVVNLLESRIDSSREEDPEDFLKEIWTLGNQGHAPLFKKKAADQLYIKTIEKLSDGNDLQALRYLFKHIPFISNHTHEPRQTIAQYFQETLIKSYKVKPNPTINMIDEIFEVTGPQITTGKFFAYTQALIQHAFSVTGITKEGLPQHTQKYLYPNKPNGAALSIGSFLAKAQP